MLKTYLNDYLILTFLTYRVNVSDKDVSDQDIYGHLIDAASHNVDTTLVISPVFLGERHQPKVRGHVTNIGSDNLCVGDVSSALMKGIVENLKEMMPSMIFEHFRVREWMNGCLNKY